MSSQYPPISDYALLSDCHSGALVSKDGSIDWCAFHRFEARPVFARLLDWDKGGYFQIAPAVDYEASRRYVPGTNVLETRFETAAGVVTVCDALVVRVEEGHPDHRLVRRVLCESGSVEVRLRFEPRFDYALTEPRVELIDDDLAIAYGGPDALVLQSELAIGASGMSACDAVHTLTEGDDLLVALTWCLPQELKPEPKRLPRERILGELDGTIGYWQAWSDRCTYEGPYRDNVLRSGLVLKGLTNGPTGAIVAAATTSLPEDLGGERNWDYRYSWLRDSALTVNALFMLGYTDEAHAYMTWLRRTTAGSAKALQIMYGAGGERFLPEIELEHLDGYRGSRPVRAGNGAAAQFQLDVYGEMLDAAWHYRRHGGEIDDVFWEFLSRVGEAVLEQWEQPDSGIWEIRGEPRHFVSSKVMPRPNGQRNHGFGSMPVTSRIVSSARSTSRRNHSSESPFIGAWKFEWFPIRWPAAAMRCASSGYARVQRPWRKNEPRTFSEPSVSRIRSSPPGRAGRPGNSVSNESATFTAPV